MINNGFMYWIFFGLCKMIYGLIPGLYQAFEFFGTVQFFDLDTDIKTIWGNLYVLLSVLVLFAIAIKLINAIVNPDVLSDSKKGVKKVYFKAFVAVFLTVLTPYMFTLLIHVQENIYENRTIEKIFFDAPTDENPGKVIAWTAITSFIDLTQLAEQTAGTEHAYNLNTSGLDNPDSHVFVLAEDIDTGLDNIYKSQPWQYTDTVHQNPILMLIAGCFIAYEFILLVMDTALRSIKLGLLQMMTPVILGAYIFKEDILKKWFLEYIKTFIQIFLLLISISLMTKVLSVLPNILELGNKYPDDPSWLLIGIINILAIIATLRLIHQVVPLINKIFGTNIEGKGGIRGRLGEMAAVGGLAQKAWDGLRTGAKNVARLGATGLAAAPYGLATGASRFLTGEKGKGLMNRLRTGRAFKDLSGVRQVRGIGSAAGAAFKTGSPGKIVEAYKTGVKPSATALDNIRAKALSERQNADINEHGVYNNLNSNNPGGFKSNADHDRDAKAIFDAGGKAFRGTTGEKLNNLMQKGYTANKKENLLTGIESSRKKVSDQLSSLYSSMSSSGHYDAKTLSEVDRISKQFDASGKISKNDADFLNKYLSTGSSELLASTYGKMSRGISDAKSMFAELANEDLNGAVSLGNNISAAKKDAAGYKADQEKLLESMTDDEKAQHKIFSEGLAEISSTTAGASQNDARIQLTGNDSWANDKAVFAGQAGSAIVSTSAAQTAAGGATASSSTTTSSGAYSTSSSSSSTVSQPASLNTGSSSARSYFDQQIDERMDYLEGKENLTPSEAAELASLQQTERASQRAYEQTQEYKEQQAQEQHDREVQERNAEIEELNRRANNRPLTRAEQMRREQLNSAKEYDENGGSIDE